MDYVIHLILVHITLLSGSLLLPLALLANASSALPFQTLTYTEAYAIVLAEEEAKERKKDAEYAEVLNHPDSISVHSSVDSSGQEIIRIGRRPAEKKPKTPRKPLDPKTLAKLKAQPGKPMIHVSLSGEVDKNGISEVWWADKQGLKHRIFTNANFFYFTGFASFQNETHRYQTFLMISQRPPHVDSGDAWRPSPKDFPEENIEYFAVEPKDPDSADYTNLEAMLTYYAEHSTDMKTTYENRQLLARARKDYLKAHPPKERPFMMFFPTSSPREAKR